MKSFNNNPLQTSKQSDPNNEESELKSENLNALQVSLTFSAGDVIIFEDKSIKNWIHEFISIKEGIR